MAAVFPAVKAVGEELGEKIFYLTAKTITQNSGKSGIRDPEEAGSEDESHHIDGKKRSVSVRKLSVIRMHVHMPKDIFDRVNAAVYELLTSTDEM